MDPVFDPRSGKMVDPQTGLPVSGNYQPPPRVSTFDQMFNGTGIPERINAGHSLFNPVVALGESGQHTQNMLSPGRAPWERVSDLGKAMTGMAGTVAPMMMAARGALPTTNALVDAMSGVSLPGGEFLADEFGGVKMPGQGGITAYHGSPHSFDRFSMDKIGTGEGAQAYGHGLYFAESEDVARSYRDALTYQKSKADSSWAPAMQPGQSESDWIKAVDAAKPKGSMYEVRINANPDDFLDWDKPLSEQAESVRTGVNKSMRDIGISQTLADYIVNNKTGMDALTTLSRGDYMPQYIPLDGAPAARASNGLHTQGIPGIKYLDAGSRGAGDGSRNYVVFDENLIEIVKKYGIAGAAAMLGMSAADLENRMGKPKMTPGGLGVGG